MGGAVPGTRDLSLEKPQLIASCRLPWRIPKPIQPARGIRNSGSLIASLAALLLKEILKHGKISDTVGVLLRRSHL